MSGSHITRRHMLKGAGVAAALTAPHVSAIAREVAPQWSAKQFHNQPASSPLHQHLTKMWEAVDRQTGGRLVVNVFPQNNGIAGSDPAALDMLRKGDLEFYTLMGGILSNVVPPMDIQGLPFAFQKSEIMFAAMDGPLGAYLRAECLGKGIHLFQNGLFENGFRDLNTVDRQVHNVDDMAGLKIRVPDGQIFRDLFTTLGAEPVTMNINQLYDGLKEHKVDGQENPLVICETNRLYEVTKYIARTHHAWSGFNLLANQGFWAKLPRSVQRVVDRNVQLYVAAQRKATMALNHDLEKTLVARGMTIEDVDTKGFRQKLAGGFYPRWKQQIGAKAWDMLEQRSGRIG